MHQPVGDLFSDTLVERLARTRRVGVLTGAGISAESGVPTFRDEGGLWQRFKPEELANVKAFLENPALVQGWYRHRREVIEGVDPNPGHDALAALEQLVTERGGSFHLATQNVDGLHHRAGSESVSELHGSLTRTYCIDCEREATPDEVAALTNADDETRAECPDCGGLLRPDVVWFGEQLPETEIRAAERAAGTADVYLSVGTSSVVFPAAGLPLTAAANGAYTAEINPERTPLSRQLDEHVSGKAGDVLPRLVERVRTMQAETS